MIPGRLYLSMLILGGSATALSAQTRLGLTGMAQATLVGSRADPTPYDGPLTEIRIVSPSLMGEASYGRFRGILTVNLEGATIRHGVLTPGAWGEGFVDRRHPHTTFHEVMVDASDLLGSRDGSARMGVALGKGFVPFGTDDPMSRPFVSYPVNHHFSQLLERAVALAQYQVGPVTVEGALFNGDEPEHPSQWPLLRTEDGRWRFGDSRAGRVTFRPLRGLELQGSLASVHSPEYRPGGAGDADKTSLSARWMDRPAWGERYALVEWARTSEFEGYYRFHSVLAEGSVTHRRLGLAYRFESTDRPEEERTTDRFHALRPHLENSILGIGRWTLHTVRVSADLLSPSRVTQVQPFIEVTAGHVRKIGGGIFDPMFTYDGGGISQISLGLTVGWSMRGHRMGRYGVLASDGMPGMAGMHGMEMSHQQ